MSSIKSIIRISVLAFFVIGAIETGYSQDKPSAPKSAGETAKEIKKKQWERDRESKRATDKALKAHMDHQTKDVRKRLKKDAKRSERINGSAHSKG